jgi:alcohol dehydrogenase (cytochrome c)
MRWKLCVSTPIRFYLRALLTASIFLCTAAARSQSADNQPGTPIDVTAQDLEANETRSYWLNWLSYHGDFTGRRYSSLKEITPDNIAQLQLKWVFHSRKVRVLGAPPVVVGGVMYMTASNDLFAIDGRTGAVLWHYTRQETVGEKEGESAHVNRGVAILSNKLYMETDNSHLLCIDARSGNVVWEVPFADGYPSYGGVSVPLAIRDKVIVGASGGKEIQGGFLTAFDAASGKEVWKLGMLPAYGQSGMPGTYDPNLDLIFWETGAQSCNSEASAKSADARQGRCLIALDSSTGKLKWQSPLPNQELLSPAISGVPVLLDTMYQGTLRKLIIAADSNGLLDILDRETGKLLAQRNPDLMKLSKDTCFEENLSPSWNPPSYNEQIHIFYFMSLQDCRASSAQPVAGHPAPGANAEPKPIGKSTLLAYDLASDKLVWKDDWAAADHAPTGVMTTASGLLLLGGKTQSFQAVDAATGKVLWSFPMGQSPTGSPMSYAIEDNQYFAIAAGNDLFVFGLP